MKCFIKLAPVYRRGHRFDSIGVASTNGDEDTLWRCDCRRQSAEKTAVFKPAKKFFLSLSPDPPSFETHLDTNEGQCAELDGSVDLG